ncbi:PAD4 [Hibiscus syriacus]|uniref:PAD4 n=1 Tax=Hibiscus syriacus TaxID=106335 RepID=A0A6A2ZHY8_HIBSY|nr:PAD4 [Hibiscus syriacus]
METGTSCHTKFESSEMLATFLASTSLLEEAWKACSIANTRFPNSYLVQQIGTVGYVAFSGRQFDSDLEQSCRDLLPLDAADGGLFAPLYRHSQAEEPIKVHHGMLKLFLSFYSGLRIQIAALVGKVNSIVMTGHSIGGTAAALSALWLLCHLQSTMPVLCITFGSPMLGNEALHRSILRQRWGGIFCHVVSKHDIVPRILFAAEITNHVSIQRMCQLPQDLNSNIFQCVLKDMEMLAHAKDVSTETLFWPFGSYVFCSQEGAVCVENAASVIQMMYLMMAMGSPSCCIEDHLKYGDYVGEVCKQFLNAKSFHENGDGLPDSSFEAGVALALQSSNLTDKGPFQVQDWNLRENVEIMAKECLQMCQNDHRPNLTAANLAIRLSKIAPFRAEIEWYKAFCDGADDQMGYYDSFKRRAGSRREARVNMNRHKLALFWNSVIHMLENNELPHDFDRRDKWVFASLSYKLLVEPLDIADYYRTGMHRQHGHYIENGRERRYEIFEKWWRDRSVQMKNTRGVNSPA